MTVAYCYILPAFLTHLKLLMQCIPQDANISWDVVKSEENLRGYVAEKELETEQTGEIMRGGGDT